MGWVFEEEIRTSRNLMLGQFHRILDVRCRFLFLDCECCGPVGPIDVQIQSLKCGELRARRAQDDKRGVGLDNAPARLSLDGWV